MRTEVEKIFHELVDLPETARSRFFLEHKIDTETRREVEALIAFDTATSTSLKFDISQVADSALERFDPTGQLCGHYRLGASLGRGGMGAVFLAEREDGEVSQKVAVKLLRPGGDDPQLRARFILERQILASLTHPYIARLLDAGHREDGQPYLVMEYVAGKSIDVHTAHLTVRQKIALFLKVCSAVAYLHRNLVVHRDLKPGNILVTAEGEPKLLDFGIAKMLDLNAESTVTLTRMLTPDYASPEQVRGDPITTVTDIYSLGAVLYKLLTGVPPHQFHGDSAKSVAFAIATGKIVPPSKVVPELKGDLDAVLMKALRTEPQERYASVDAFAADLRAYLEWRPVQAAAGDVWYRTRRLLRRHWVPAAAAAVVVTSLSTGLIVASRERAIAERRFAQLRHLSNRVIDLDRSIRVLPGSVAARQQLVAASLEYLEGMYQEAGNNIDLLQDISDGYWRMARIQGVNAEPNLGDTRKAEESLQRADLLMKRVLASRPLNRGALFRSAAIAADRTILADTEDRRKDVLLHAGEAVDSLECFLELDDPTHPVRLEGFLRPGDSRQAEITGAATLYTNIAIAYVNKHEYADGARCARRAVDLALPLTMARDTAGQAFSVLANALRYEGDLEGALNAIHRARALLEQATYPSETARLFAVYGVTVREGRILGERGAVNLGRPAEAIEVLQKAMNLVEGAVRADSSDSGSRGRVATTARELGDILRDRDPRRALAVYERGIQRLEEMPRSIKARRDHAQLLAYSSYPLRRLHRVAEAKARIDAAVAILQGTKDYPAEQIGLGSYDYAIMCAMADQEADSGNPARAVEIYEDLLRKVMSTEPKPETNLTDAVHLSSLYETMARLNRRAGRNDRAYGFEDRSFALWQHWDARLPNNSFVRRQLSATNHHADAVISSSY